MDIQTSPIQITKKIKEADGVYSLTLTHDSLVDIKPGQFNMLYGFGHGEIPISISGFSANNKKVKLIHTIRSVGKASDYLCRLSSKSIIGVRGPFGSAWPLEKLANKYVMIIAGGIGLAPLRPVIHYLKQTNIAKHVSVLIGARSAKDIIFKKEILEWRKNYGWHVQVTVDYATKGWSGDIGVVTNLMNRAFKDSKNTVVLTCGPEIMMNFAIGKAIMLGISDENIYLSMERNMQCGFGLCGHCQWGPYFVCKDGPIFQYKKVSGLLNKSEL